MRKFGLLGTSALRSAVFIGFATTFATGAVAQETATEADPPATLQTETEIESGQDAQSGGETLVVTGTRIRSPNLTSTVPITSLGVQELTDTGDVSIGDQLNELPALRSTFSQSNSIRFIGTAGLNVLDLRGLGTARTLVLVNGRRHITASPGDSSVDTNTIPTDLLERVDIVTGGNSAIYGSDAVAGVVNFILKRDFEGFKIRGQGGISERGDRGSYFVSATAGHNFADDRGNVAVNLEYTKAQALYFTDREADYGAFSGRRQFNITENTLGEPSTGNGIPDNTFLEGVTNIGISTGGAYSSACPTATATNAPRRALNCTGLLNPSGAELGRVFVFDQSGNLVPNIGIADLRTVGSGNNIRGLGSTLREVGQLQPGVDRYMANFLGSFEFSPAFRLFAEAKYARVDAIQEGQPTFFNNVFSIDNPFLTEQARSVLVNSLAPGATLFAAQRFNIDFEGRGENHKRETYRIVAGVDGTFNDDWRYEVALNYGRLETFYETKGNVLIEEYFNSVDAVRNDAGQIVCGINADDDTTNDDAACVPVNLFGLGAPSQAALDYFGYTSSRREHANQYNATAYVSGDLSQLFELPGGPVGFAVGGEYRKETAFSDFDDISQADLTFLNAIPTFDPPNLEVKEAFAEIRIPLLRDMPFAEELTIEAAGRVSDYNIGSTGTVFAYNVGAIYSPIRDVRFRAGYARSVRAPTQGDLFAEPSQTFLNGLVDPCGQQNINNNPNRVANCAAAGVPTTQTFAPPGGTATTEPFTNRPASGILGLNGSNPNLTEEKGTSYTVGVVVQPRFVPGLSVSLDYYKITIDDVIFSLAAQTIINQCYDSPSGIDNPFCASITRNPNGTFAGQSNVLHGGTTIEFDRTGSSFLSGPFNFAKQKTSGIDLDTAYRTTLGSGIVLNLRGILSYLIERNNFTDINQPDFINRQKGELGDPEWEASLSANLDFGAWDLGYNMRYIGKQTIGTWEAQHSLQGRPAENPDQFPVVFYPNVMYHDFRLGFEPERNFKFYVGIDNAFDRRPPFGLTGTGSGDAIYENVRRFFYAGAEVRF